MSNPPPYPGGTLTEKFAALSADVAAYIESVNTDLAAIKAQQTALNSGLAVIIGAIGALTPLIQQAADCSCAAAEALEDAPWNTEEPPPEATCDDPLSDPDALEYQDYVAFGPTFWVENSGEYYGDWSSSDIVSNPKVGFEGFTNLILTGPGWYKVASDRNTDATFMYVANSPSNPEATYGFDYNLTTTTSRSDTFFVPAGETTAVIAVIGVPAGDPSSADQSVFTVSICLGAAPPS